MLRRDFPLLALVTAAACLIGACGDTSSNIDPADTPTPPDTGTEIDAAAETEIEGDTVSSGEIYGTVTLGDGAAPTGVQVDLGHGGDVREVVLDATGTYAFADLDAGVYVLRAWHAGYSTSQLEITLLAGQRIEANFNLQVAAPDNHDPVISALNVPALVARNSAVEVSVVASDPDGDPLTYEWQADQGFRIAVGQAGATATLLAPDAGDVSGTVRVIVSDGRGGNTQQTAEVRTSMNHAPIIQSLSADDDRLAPKGATVVRVNATDPDGDPLTYTWSITPAPHQPPWVLTDGDTSAFVTAANMFGAAAVVKVVVSDDKDGTAEAIVAIATTPCDSGLDCDGDADNGCEAPDSALAAYCPAKSCVDVVRSGHDRGDGHYWLSPSGDAADAYQAYCEMESDGGGWELVATISGADTNQWASASGHWTSTQTLGSIENPWLDYKSSAWWTLDISTAEALLVRRFDDQIQARVKLGAQCLAGAAAFNQLFTTFDTSLACPPEAIAVYQGAATGLASADYTEGSGRAGLGNPQTNGFCWSVEDTAVNTFKGRLGWNEVPGASCAHATHAGGVAVFEHAGGQYTTADITGTSWLVGTDYTKTALSIFARPSVGLSGDRTLADPARFADGTLAPDCLGYRHPPLGYLYAGATGDGLYRIDPDGDGPLDPVVVFCDMSTDGGGWTAIVANGDNTTPETFDENDCYPLITNDPSRGCGDPTDLLADFSMNGEVQGALQWRHLLGVAYGDNGYTEKIAYFAIDFGSAAPTTQERIGGTPYVPNPIAVSDGIIRCANRASGNERIVHYTMAGTYVGNDTNIAFERGTVFGHNQAPSMNSNLRQTLGFTDTAERANGSLLGLDDYQDGWSCGDNWLPAVARHARLVVLVR